VHLACPFFLRLEVEKKKWVKPEEIVDLLAIVQSVPGIIAVNAAVFVGNRVAGSLGALAAAIGVVTPSFIIIVLIAAFMTELGHVALIDKAFTGVRAGVCALILLAALRLGKKVMKGRFEWIMATLAFIGIVILKLNVIWIIAGAGVIGLCRYYINIKKHQAQRRINNEHLYPIPALLYFYKNRYFYFRRWLCYDPAVLCGTGLQI
jgi:chromate transporter